MCNEVLASTDKETRNSKINYKIVGLMLMSHLPTCYTYINYSDND